MAGRRKRTLGPDPDELAADRVARAQLGAASTIMAGRVRALLQAKLPKLRRDPTSGKYVEDTASETQQESMMHRRKSRVQAGNGLVRTEALLTKPVKRVQFDLGDGNVKCPGESDDEETKSEALQRQIEAAAKASLQKKRLGSSAR